MATTSMGRTPEEQAEFDEQQEFSDGFTVAETSGQLFERLTPSSTVEEISAAYNEFQQNNGGNSAANRDVAKLFLNSLGVPSSTIEQGLSAFSGARPGPMTSAEAQEKIYEELKGQSQNLGTEKSLQTGASGTKEGGLGSTDAVMRDMAKKLADAGLTSIEQFGQGKVPIMERVYAYPEYVNGPVIGYDENGEIYKQVPSGRWAYDVHEIYGDNDYTTRKYIDNAEVSRLGLSGTRAKTVELQNGEKDGFINKATGEPLTSLTGYDGRGWSGTSAGDGQTIYNVQFDAATGLPIFYNQQKHGKDAYADLIKIVAIGSAIFAPQIGAALLPAGAPAAAALAVGSAVSGFIGSGGDIKQGIKAGLAAYLGGQAGSWASKASNSVLVGNIASNMTRTAILGGDMQQALVSSLVQAAPAEIIKHFPNFNQLPRAAQEAAVAATVDLMRTGGENLDTIAIKGATDGITDYTLKQIPGFDDLRKGQQEIVRERMGNVVRGESLTDELLQGAIQMGSEAVRYQVDTDRAVKAGWKTLEEQQAATSLYGSKVTPAQFADKQDTTEDEAKQIARDILGREPTEFEYMQLIGLPEREAAQNSDLSAIRFDESTFDSNELAEAYKAVYGVEPTAEWLASDEAFDMLGRSDAQAKNILQNYYVKDKNTTTGSEAEAMWKAMGNTGPIPEDVLFNMLSMSQPSATAYAQNYTDAASVTFDGSGYETTAQARAAAIGAGYNSFTDPVTGKTQVILPEDETLKRSNLMRQVLDAQGVNPATATAEQRDQAMKLVSGIAQDKLDSTNVVDLMADAGIAGGSFVKPRGIDLKYVLAGAPAASAPRAFDGTKYGSQTNAAIAAASRGQDTFTWTDGKTYKVPNEITTDAKSGALRDRSFANDLVSLADAYARGEISNTQYKFLEAGVKKQTAAVNKLVANRDLKSAQEAAGQTVGWANLGVESKQSISMLDRAADRVLSLGEGAGNFVSNIGQTIAALTIDPNGEGDITTGFVSGVPKMWMDPKNNFVTNTGNNIAEFFTSRYSDDAKKQRDAIRAEANRPGATEASVAAVVLNNLHGYSTFTGSELAEEIIPFLAGGGVGAVLKLGRAGLVALTGTAATLGDMAEVYGPTYTRVRDESLRRGDSEATANALATRAASGNTLITVVTEGPLNFMLAKSLLVDTAKNAAYKVGGNIAAQMAGEYVESMGHNANELYTMTGRVANAEDLNGWRGQATFEALIAGGTTSGMYVLAAANPNKIIGKDYSGNDFTVADALTKPGQFDAKTLRYDSKIIDPITGRESDFLDVMNNATTTYAGGYSTEITESVISRNPTQSLEIMQDMGLANWGSNGEITFSPNAGNIATAFIASNTVLPQANGTFAPTFDASTLPGVTSPSVVAPIAPPAASPVLPAAPETPVASDASTTVTAPATPPATPPSTGGEVVAVDPDEGTALVVDGNGNVNVVDNTDGALAPGNTVSTPPTVPVTPPAQTQPDTGGETQTGGVDFADPTDNVVDPTLDDLLSGIGEEGATTPNLPAVIPPTTPAEPVAPVAPTSPDVSGQLAGIETRLTDAIAAAETMGLTRDQAITAAVESVAAELGTTKTELLTQLGTTEAALRGEIAGVSADVQAKFDALTTEQKALATQLQQQGADLNTAIEQARAQTQGQIGTLAADVQAKYDALTAEQKSLANDIAQQGVDMTTAINLAQQQTQTQITGLGQQVDTRINELMQQGQTYQQATQQAINELNQQNTQMAQQIGTQGRTATQADIDAIQQMLTGQTAVNPAYDVTGDNQVTQADIDFLTNVVSGTKTDWTPPTGSVFAPTGLYGQLASIEAQRQADLVAQQTREAEAERQRQQQQKVTAAQQGVQSLMGMVPQMYKAAEETTTPLYSTMDYYDPFGDPFGQTKMRTASTTIPTDQTKMAQGGYLGDLLAENMSVDDLLNLLR